MTEPDLAWNEHPLLPAVVQHVTTGAILMQAWMNREAYAKTVETGFAHFYSRSRDRLWKKGETSGHVLKVVEVRSDCDADSILVIARPTGPTCHTGRTSCFYSVRGDDGEHLGEDPPTFVPLSATVDALWTTVEQRRDQADAKASYTKSLLDAGMDHILAKIREEHDELAQELANGEPAAVVHEAGDVLYHVIVGLAARGITSEALWLELRRRFGMSGHEEKASRK